MDGDRNEHGTAYETAVGMAASVCRICGVLITLIPSGSTSRRRISLKGQRYMSDIDQEQIGSANPPGNAETEPGQLHIAEKASLTVPDSSVATAPSAQVQPATSRPSQFQERIGTVEHLAARRPMPALDTSTPEMKQLLATLRAEWTRLVTGLRWEGQSVKETATRMIPLLNVGPVEQWKSVLIPFLYEIDRGGALIPAWLNIIERGDPPDLSQDANPAETLEGRARRFAILMLGNYKMMGISGLGQASRLAKSTRNGTISSERNRAVSTSTSAPERFS